MACCFQMHGKHVLQSGCDLDGSNWGNSDEQRSPQATSEALNVYLRVSHGKVDKVRAFSASCPVRDADKVRWLDNVAPQASVAYLAASTAATPSEDIFDAELAALAMHADPAATPALRDLSGQSHPRKVREQSLFWLGQMRGAEGAQVVEHAATTDADPELRAHAVFVLSEAHGVDGYAAIHRIAQSDRPATCANRRCSGWRRRRRARQGRHHRCDRQGGLERRARARRVRAVANSRRAKPKPR
jgi:hypothetical protein